MAPAIRVVGRIDLAQEICAALRSAGMDADVTTAGPMTVFHGAPPAEGIDVVVATSVWDPPLWRLAKKKHPLRPMVAVAERRREPALRGAMAHRHGPDAYVTWPASAADLTAAVQQAKASAGRRRAWGRGDLAGALVWLGLFVSYAGGALGRGEGGAHAAEALVRGAGALAAAVGLLLQHRFSCHPLLQAAGGVLLAALGGAGVVLSAVEWLR